MPSVKLIALRFILIGPLAGFISLQASLDYSIDPTSPEAWNPGDIVKALGDELRIGIAETSLLNTDDIVGFSYGNDEIEVLTDYNFTRVAYSVSRSSSGFYGLVAIQNFLNGAAGDKFGLTAVNYRGRTIVLRGPYLISDAPVHSLSPKPTQSELDGMSLFLQTDRFPLYVAMSATSGYDPNAVYIIRSAGSSPEVFATGADLGLGPGDEIDALAVGTVPVTLPPPQSLGPGVVIWVSLKTGSPTRSIAEARGGDGILQVYPGSPILVIDALSLDLRPGDELDALTGLDPGEVPVPVDLITLPKSTIVDADFLSGRQAVSNSGVAGSVYMDRSTNIPVAVVEVGQPPFSSTSLAIRGSNPAPDSFVEVKDINLTTEREKLFDLGTAYVTIQVNSTGFTIDGESTVQVPRGATVRLKFALGVPPDSALRWTGKFEILSLDEDYEVVESFAFPDGSSAMLGTGNHIQLDGEQTPNLGRNDIWDSHLTLSLDDDKPNYFQIADAKAQIAKVYSTDPLKVMLGVQTLDNTAKNLLFSTYDAEGNLTQSELTVNPNASAENPLSASVLIGLSIQRATGTFKVRYWEPLNSTGLEPVEIAGIAATEDALAIGVNVESEWGFFGLNWGASNQPGSYIIKVASADEESSWEENPEITDVIDTINSPLITPRIVDMVLNEATDELGVIQSSETETTFQGDFTYYNLNRTTRATQLQTHSAGAHFESGLFSIIFSDFSFGESQLASTTGINPNLNRQGITFGRLFTYSGRWATAGRVYASGSIIHPGNIQIPHENGSQQDEPTAFLLGNIPADLPIAGLDSDGDGYTDRSEILYLTDPYNKLSTPLYSFEVTATGISISTSINPAAAQKLALETETSTDLTNWESSDGSWAFPDPTTVKWGEFSKGTDFYFRTRTNEKVIF